VISGAAQVDGAAAEAGAKAIEGDGTEDMEEGTGHWPQAAGEAERRAAERRFFRGRWPLWQSDRNFFFCFPRREKAAPGSSLLPSLSLEIRFLLYIFRISDAARNPANFL
jgi:hypothetical protein